MSVEVEGKTAKPGPLRTLMQAHEELVRIRPGGDASLAVWLGYYQRSVALYEQIAEIDPFHGLEARYWAQRERHRAEEIVARLRAQRLRT
ncbi:MAG: AMED_5909 family protein [Pseudonocardiaceae bacterium]